MKPADEAPLAGPLTATDWHVLVALVDRHLHGYAIMQAVERDSGGVVTAGIGSLYRLLSRLMTEGLVREVATPDDAPTETRGRSRRYYALTDHGQQALRQEALRLHRALELARSHQLLPDASR
ncbi:MAG: PadR family transcriptional regulator [Gemmatimonadetes bacterium]|nr:PadR family transcriptional regulator [Gemmatimonadota bacterium]MDA1104421.1 PadR family transcriptional regulator [Gemmatimonadota bacterium]